MFEKIHQLAEQAATGVSRRHFLASVGRHAAVTALAAAGLFVPLHGASAARKGCPKGCHPCKAGCCRNGGGRC
jgi:hypothetical protein